MTAIPGEAVEAAARATQEVCESYDPGGWTEEENWAIWARQILEAGAPLIAAQAWEEGATAGWKQSGEGWNAEYPDESTGKCSVDLTGNPYRG